MNRLRVCLMMWFVVFAAGASQLQQISVSQQPRGITFNFGVSGADRHQVFMLHNPERVVIDFTDTSTSLNVARAVGTNPYIREVRVGHPTPRQLRLVFEMKQPVTSRTAIWHPQASQRKGWQLQLQSRGVTQSTAHPISHSPTRHNREVIIVLDPGHGGKDPGAIGIRRTREKNVVLAIARRLKALIDKEPGMHAVLTRDKDYYVGLRARMQIARRHNADLFIAIHADAFENHNSHGASVFALSQRGATSEAARWLAAKENYSELGGVNLANLDDENGVIRSVLIDLSQTATIGASLQLGQQILYKLRNLTTLHSHKVEQARFMVLKSPDIPSLLIETGFISNQSEEMNLNNPAYQARMSQAMLQGIHHYFWEYPPHGSRIEAMVQQRPYPSKLPLRPSSRRGRG